MYMLIVDVYVDEVYVEHSYIDKENRSFGLNPMLAAKDLRICRERRSCSGGKG
jgi:hypothetical protein